MRRRARAGRGNALTINGAADGVYHRNVIKSVPQDRVARVESLSRLPCFPHQLTCPLFLQLLEEWKNAKLLEGDDLK